MAPVDCEDSIDISERISTKDHFVYSGPIGRVTGDYIWGENGMIVEQSDGGKLIGEK